MSLLYTIYFSLQREDDFSIGDKMAGPNVSIIQRFHCMYES